MALEHGLTDAEILSRALGLAQNERGPDRVPAAARGRHSGHRGARPGDGGPGDRRRRSVPLGAGRRPCASGAIERGPSCFTDPIPQVSSSAYLRDDPVDLLVVGSHGHGLVRDLLFGQTVDRVRHNLEIPMLIARPGRGWSHLPPIRPEPCRRPSGRKRPTFAVRLPAARLDVRPIDLSFASEPRMLRFPVCPMLRRPIPTGARARIFMAITYYKRLRMEIDLEASIPPASLPGRFVWVPWEESLLADHAEVKYQSFRGEIDAYVFPCLGDRYGCQRLMREIRRKPGFLPSATWLIACPEGYVGTVQGVMDHGPDRRDPEPGRVSRPTGGSAWVEPWCTGHLRDSSSRAYGGPTWRSPPRTTPPSSSTGAWDSDARRPCTRPWTA